MAHALALFIKFICPALFLSGCTAIWFSEDREIWRDQTERDCLTSGVIALSPFVRPHEEINGPGICGASSPLTVTALQNGKVAFSTKAIMGCPAVVAVDTWLSQSVQPSALAVYGQPVTELDIAASYACRQRNNGDKGPLSEHAFANALDVSAFTLADGTRVTVKDDWKREANGAFLKAVHSGACRTFTTVLGPDADRHHRDHLHMDLARHGASGTYRVCQ